MKKYIAAAAVAVMVFAFAAFAATFELNDSVLAVGEGDVTDCGDIEVVSWGLETDDGTVDSVRLDVKDCTDDEVLFVRVLDEDDNRISFSGEYRIGSNTVNGTERVSFPPVHTADIEGLEIFVHTKK